MKKDGTKLIPLTEMKDLPVLVAVRMSLSFPILLSAVPLYAVDFSLKRNQTNDPTSTRLGERCWFSDGGICSNFPIHFFDGPLPRWPTFGISLDTPNPEHPEAVWMPDSNAKGVLPRWNHFDESRPTSFVAAILATAMGWRDSLQMRLPAFRDRIVHIRLPDSLGGLHLDMTKPMICQLVDYGANAGETILKTFKASEHVWARYRSTMCTLQRFGERFGNAYRHPVPQDQTIWPTITDPKRASPNHYEMSSHQHARACTETENFVRLTESWSSSNTFCDRHAPHPEPELRAVPKP
jgi:predicted acylesterase/phospholipase RssA